MSFIRTLFMAAFAFLATLFMQPLFAQSCSGNLLHDATGYYGGFESGAQSIGAGRGFTDLSYGSRHGGYQVVSEANKPWEDLNGGGYLSLSVRSGDFMMLIHTSNARLWYKDVSVVPGQTLTFCAAIASAKEKPVNGFEIRLRVKYGTTTAVIATATAQQGKWSQICGSFTVPAGVTSIEFQLVDPYPNSGISNFLFLDDLCIRAEVRLNPDINATYIDVPVTGNVFTNDAVPLGYTYGTPVAVAGNPSGALITVNSNGSYTFTTSALPGVYRYNVPVCAPGQAFNCYTSLLTITVLDRNSIRNAPVANTDFATTRMRTSIMLNTLSNDAAGNINGILNPASVTIIAAPKNGTATVNTSTGAITYTPVNGFSGNDTLRYRVCDQSTPAALCASAIQVITVRAGDASNTTTAADDYVFTSVNTPVSGNVKSNDTDAEGNSQTVTAQSLTVAGKGTLLLSSSGAFTFTPAAGYVGPVLFVYTTCDNGAPQACANATVYMLVQAHGSMTPLPVSLYSFTGNPEGEKVRLQWETTAEINSDRFEVLHSTTGNQWQTIGTVKAAGNSSIAAGYSFLHATPARGLNYYRLQWVDANGRATTSKIITAKVGGNNAIQANVYPNPFAGSVQLTVYAESASKMGVQLFDINGKLVHRQEKMVPAGESLLTLTGLENLTNGTYIIKASLGEVAMTQKLFKH